MSHDRKANTEKEEDHPLHPSLKAEVENVLREIYGGEIPYAEGDKNRCRIKPMFRDAEFKRCILKKSHEHHHYDGEGHLFLMEK